MSEQLKKPDRYTGKSGMQVFDIWDEFDLDPYEANVVKYVIRHKKKNGLTDLKKARVYLDYMIEGGQTAKEYTARIVDWDAYNPVLSMENKPEEMRALKNSYRVKVIPLDEARK
ncbi:DUF3310 domain-containing protein [Fructobacillus sp. CRL 2054]|uniref:DUF3310 domain-containing protein n=1 Tax=Fructobacillus sp. CRL 2054 TaxID=2763007 RepID=UPI00237933C9|nr:DUF3310 domain-containing protein [Fructobacillus sp. CRL 2054]MDD9139154.1 DUF3310 domain-containing protein [Fructobacillus sp. CRL 2054]